MQLSGIREDVDGLVAFYRTEGAEATAQESTECVKTGDSASCSFSSAPIAAKNALKLIIGSSACDSNDPNDDSCPWPLVYTNEQPLVGQGGNVQLKWDADASTSLTDYTLVLNWPENEGADSVRVLFQTPKADGAVISFVGELNKVELTPINNATCMLFDNKHQSKCWLPTPSQGGWVFDLRIYVEAQSNWIEVSTVTNWGGEEINVVCPDADGDGYAMAACATGEGGGDCDDSDNSIYPNASELEDDLDNDCDGKVDEGLDSNDDDGDGFSEVEGDCNDNDDSMHPNATETPYDGIDQDCREGDLVDVDLDTYDSSDVGGPDCDDANVNTYPGASEFEDNQDNDCDGKIDEDLETNDDDGDGLSEQEGDCNDTNASIYPGAPELCNEVDDDCDHLVDEGSLALSPSYPDTDNDGFGDSYNSTLECPVPTGNVSISGDCDDEDESIHPEATEIPYDGIDQDCSGRDLTDVDGDGDESKTVGGTDCNDNYAEINPGSTEKPYDGIDQDCSGKDLTDVDKDGFDSVIVTGGTDCNDDAGNVHPGAVDTRCNGVDENCIAGDACETAEGLLSTSDADVSFISTVTGDDLGRKLSPAGDTNGDGYADILIGAPSFDGGNGAVYLVRGKSGFREDYDIPLDPGSDHSDAEVLRYSGSTKTTTALLGSELAGGSDTDGDGLDDFLVGINHPDRQGAYLIHGVKSALSTYFCGFDSSAESWYVQGGAIGAGSAVAMGGNFVGITGPDPQNDIAIGAVLMYNNKGQQTGGVEIYPGLIPNVGLLGVDDIALSIYGVNAGDPRPQLGSTLSFVGDVNGDGCDDLLVGQPENSSTQSSYGAAFLVYGPCDEADPADIPLDDLNPTGGYVAFAVGEGSGLGNRLGASLGAGTCHIGDGLAPVDAVKRPDLLLTDYSDSSAGTYAGSVFLIYGETLTGVSRVTIPSTNNKVPVITLRGESAYDRAGRSVACAGDVDGNGYDDILIGAPTWSQTEGDGQPAQGAAYLFYAASDGSGIGSLVRGERSLSTADAIIYGSGSDREVGTSVAGVGDVNGDHYDDILISASNMHGTGKGGAYLFYGGPR